VDPAAVSYEMLQDLLRSERRSNKLMSLEARFWLETRDFLTRITEAFRLEQAKDPFGRRVMLLTDEVKNARHAAESLWALRERKLAMLALAATRERKRPEGITPEESDLYGRMLETLESSRKLILDGLSAASLAPGPLTLPGLAAVAPTPTPIPPSVQMPIAEPPKSPILAVPAAPPAAVQVVPSDTAGGATLEMVTIRALGDIPPFVGPDMQTYLLKSGDIATVPPSIAQLLVRRNKAAVVDA
jgi:DNA replication initiation complex subunit (GINS family)